MKKLFVIFILSILFIFGARLLMQPVVENYVNTKLQTNDAYIGSVDAISLSLLKGEYQIYGMRLVQRSDMQTPFFEASRIDISLSWAKLIEGKVVSDIHLQDPVITLVDNTQKQDIQSDELKDPSTWIGLKDSLVPFSIDKLTINQGLLVLRAIAPDTIGDIEISQINGALLNFSNDIQSDLASSFDLSAEIEDEAQLTVKGSLNPNTIKPSFDLDAKMTKLPVSQISGLTDIYAPFDLEAGELDMAFEMKSDQAKVEGYAEIGIFDVRIFTWKEDVINDVIEGNESIFQPLIEGVSGLFAQVLESDNKDLLATKVPFKGSIDNPEADYVGAFWNLLRNAFIESYDLEVDESIEAQDLSASAESSSKNLRKI